MIFQDISKAVKRARHFTKGMSWSSCYYPVAKTGLAVPVRNWFWFLDLAFTEENASVEGPADRVKGDLYAIWKLSCAVNAWIDGNQVEGDEVAKMALGSFLSKIDDYGINWEKLCS